MLYRCADTRGTHDELCHADIVADDGNTPTVASIGPCTIDIYTGSKNQQTQLQNLGKSVDVSKASSVSVTVDPSIGPNGDYYFVRVTSLGLKDTTNPQYPYQAFSAKFELDGMSGNFSQAILAQIADSGSNNVAAVSWAITQCQTLHRRVGRVTQ